MAGSEALRARALRLRLVRPRRQLRAPRWLVVSLAAHALAISAYASWKLASPPGGAVVRAVYASRELTYEQRADSPAPAQFEDQLAPSALEDTPLEEARVVELEPEPSEPPARESELREPFDPRSMRIPQRFASLAPPRIEAIGPTTTPSEAQQVAVVDAAPPALSETSPPAPFVAARALAERNVPPVYPRVARQRGWQGTSVLEARIDVNGHVAELRVLESSGFAVLDRAALEAVRSWLFAPARRGELALESLVEVPIVWRLAQG